VANLTQRDDSVAGQNFTTTFDHTPRNQVKSVTRGSDSSSFSFDPAGRLAAKTYTNGVTTSFTYDADGRLTAQDAVKDAQSLESFAQSYDAAGNISQLTENGTLTTNYGYDALNRLTSENIGGYGNVSYGYDRVGNRLTLDNPTTGHTDYAYNQANQLTQQVNGSITTEFSYNANGAIAQKTNGNDTTSYTYNGLDKLTEVVIPSSTVNYGYDALGRRISRSEWGGTRNFHFSAKSDLADYETDAAGALTSSMLRGPDGLIAYTYFGGGDPFTGYQLFNPHGDTSTITDVNGAIIYSSRYDSFGNAITGSALDYGYTGKWQRPQDLTTNTIQMGVREYDPALGRFTSADPLEGSPTDPQQRNRFSYTSNNPLVRYDLNGLFWDELWDAITFADDRSLTGIMWDYDMTVYDFASNFGMMKWKHDTAHARYYHCKANYEATSHGPAGEATARTLGWLKEEVIDIADPKNWGKNIDEDTAGDYAANERGRNSCSAGVSLEEACPYEGL
jgi:RHS repeat-associated protein